MTGEVIDGKKAAEWRLVNESVPLDRLEARVREIAEAAAEEESGRAQGHQGCGAPGRRHDL